jgi:quercetin dioxygenase-like cupin family protein
MTDIQIIKRDTIPQITSIQEAGAVHLLGELRDFTWSEPLRNFLSEGPEFSVSWVQLARDEVLEPHTHPVLSMMVFYAGAGRLTGDVQTKLLGDEVVVVPPGCLHGFIGGPAGISGLSIQYARGLYSNPEQPRVVFAGQTDSLSGLLALADSRAGGFSRVPTMQMLCDETVVGPTRRRALAKALRLWMSGTQLLLVSGQAACSDPAYRAAFDAGLHEFLAARRESGVSRSAPELAHDPVLEALVGWFSYQMYVLDNAEKAALVYLVVGRVNRMLRKYAAPVLGERLVEDVFGAPTADAEVGVQRVSALLHHEVPSVYARLRRCVNEGWDMAEAMLGRVGVLVCPGN